MIPDELSAIGRAIGILAHKTGVSGMIGGQTVDVELAGSDIPRDKLDFIYRLKTGALLEASMLIGAVLGGAAEEDCKIVGAWRPTSAWHPDSGRYPGRDRQQEELGKPAGSDREQSKTPYVTLEGLEKAKKDVEQLSAQAIEELEQASGQQ